MITFRFGRPGINLFEPRRIMVLLWLFLLVLPKGGFKLAGIPITWGYLLLGALSVLIPLARRQFWIHKSRLMSFLCLVPFQMVSLSHFALNGYAHKGAAISFLINFFLFPYIFFILMSPDFEALDLDDFFRLFKKGIFYVSAYGIFLFIFKQTTGKFIEIPFLTTNWSDLGTLEEKHIDRGFAFKLISTYNNGNLYGICLLIFLPLYSYLEKSPWRKAIVKLSLFLTLSRTIWIGLVFHEICYNLFVGRNTISIVRLTGSLFLLLFALIGLSLYYDFSMIDFLFDPNLGGRQLDFENLMLFSPHPFGGIGEIVYASIFQSFGVIGLCTFLIGMTGPLLVRASKGYPSKMQMSMCLGLTNYLLIACSDGGILYIPVMAFYWFISSLLAQENFLAYSE